MNQIIKRWLVLENGTTQAFNTKTLADLYANCNPNRTVLEVNGVLPQNHPEAIEETKRRMNVLMDALLSIRQNTQDIQMYDVANDAITEVGLEGEEE